MLIRYIFFCIGCALLQNAYARLPTRDMTRIEEVAHVPFLFRRAPVQAIVSVAAITSLLIEIGVGFIFISWWAGLFLWLIALIFVRFVFPIKDPSISFILGIFIVFISGCLLVFR